MIRLTKEQAEKIGYLKITWWYAIQPIEIKDGSFILPKEVLADIEAFGIDIKIDEIGTLKKVSLLDTLLKYPVVKLLPSELKIPIEIKPIEIIKAR